MNESVLADIEDMLSEHKKYLDLTKDGLTKFEILKGSSTPKLPEGLAVAFDIKGGEILYCVVKSWKE